jgi:glucose-6-phosphate 1-epimerase
VHVEGLHGRTYIDKVDGNSRKTQDGVRLVIDREVDRIYQGDIARIALVDAGLSRRIEVASNSRSAVVWNPWTDRSARMADIGPGGYRTMLCIETANAGDDIVTIQPGGTHALRASFSVAKLS